MKMPQRTHLARAVILTFFATAISVASANSLTINRVSGYYAGAGGEFSITSSDAQLLNIRNNYSSQAIVNGGFETFCLEENEFVSVPHSYVYAISDAAKSGGNGGGVNGRDPLSVGSAWLYSQFATGVLAGYNYSPGNARSASAGLLQNAIWWLEDEITLANPTSNPFLVDAFAKYGSAAAAKADNNGSFAVGVINMGVNAGNQDQIVLVPDGGMTFVLFGAALLALGAFRRRLA